VYQDLAVVDLMETWRNFFLGSELRKSIPVLRPLEYRGHEKDHGGELEKLGIHLGSVDQRLARCPEASGRASQSPARSISAPRC